MKYFYLLLIVAISQVVFTQNCPTSLTFTTQGQIDSFSINYPECTSLEILIIREEVPNTITNLNGLQAITHVGSAITGVLGIYSNKSLSNLSGLDSIEEIKGIFSILKIQDNNVLKNIEAIGQINLDNLSELSILNNPQLGSCDIPNICQQIESIPNVILTGNDCGCNTLSEINWNCVEGNYLPCGITITSQQQIDEFATNYPGCKAILGEVNIDEKIKGDITSLKGLLGIQDIYGGLFIQNNSALTNLDGLHALEAITGLAIRSNPQLIDISALHQLTAFDFLEIENNEAFTSLSGLESVDVIYEHMIVRGNNFLADFQGLRSLRRVGSSINISDNANLLSMVGLDSLSGRLNTDLIIQSNLQLIDLSGLESIDVIGRTLRISDNSSLLTLHGLGIKNVGINNGIHSHVHIANNPVLVDLHGLDSLTRIYNEDNFQPLEEGLIIRNNPTLTSLAGLSSLAVIDGSLTIENNPGLLNLSGTLLNVIKDSLAIKNNDGLRNLVGLEKLARIHTSLLIADNDHMYDMVGLSLLDYIGNDELGRLTIKNNASLINLRGFEELDQVGTPSNWPGGPNGKLNIIGNPKLISLVGLNNLTAGLSNISIHDNNLLSECAIESICWYLQEGSIITTFENNAAGCNSIDEVAMACNVPTAHCTWLGGEGFWTSPIKWDCGRVPLFYDRVFIPEGHVIVPLGTNVAKSRMLDVSSGARLTVEVASTLSIEN